MIVITGQCGLVAGINHRALICRDAPDAVAADTKRVRGKRAGHARALPGAILGAGLDALVESIVASRDATHAIITREGELG